jgi:hypothetical protein
VFERSRKSRLQRAVLASACAVLLAGCGDDDAEEPMAERPREPTVLKPAVEMSPLRERLNDLVTRLLSDRGLDPAVTECALAELAETVPDSELESAIKAIRNTGAAPPGVIEAAAAAGKACGRP